MKNIKRKEIETILSEKKYLRNKLFCRGFCITNKKDIDFSGYPFYGKWIKTSLLNGDVNIYIHPQMDMFVKEDEEGNPICLIGHAFNPFNKMYDENLILEWLLDSKDDNKEIIEKINELTGTFTIFSIKKEGIVFWGDPVGLQSVFYTIHNGIYLVSSHSNLIGDILNLEEDSLVAEIKKARYFRLFGNQLPGNISSFKNVKRLVPNHYVCINDKIEEKRFYYPSVKEVSIDAVVEEVTDILKSTMDLIGKKWNKPAISLTGGCDSKTTLACTLDFKEKYRFFSYDSQKNEAPDVEAAKTICNHLGLNLIAYDIPYNNEAFEDIESIRKIMLWNCGNVCPNNENDVRKRIYLDDIPDFDIEIKSWASEVGRSRYTKRYNGRRNFGKNPTPRKCSTFYKFLFFDRRILHKVDLVFKEYLDIFFERAKINPIPWQDQFYWEWHWPSRDGVVLTSEQKYAHDITVPYNNRRVLELLLSVPEEDRINDTVYSMIRNNIAPEIDKACEGVVDVNHTKKRAIGENLYYIVNNIIP